MKKLILITLLVMLCLSKGKAQSDTSRWKYSSTLDEMTNKTIYFAKVNDGSSCLTIRNENGKNEVMLSVNGSQFNLSIYGMFIYVRFDDSRKQKFSATSPNDNSFNVVFIHGVSGFIKQMKASKKVLIQAELFTEGDNVFHFDTTDLKWDH